MKNSNLMPFIDIFMILAASMSMLLVVLNPETSANRSRVQFKNEKQQKGKSKQMFNEKFTEISIFRNGKISVQGRPVDSVEMLKNRIKELNPDGVSVITDRNTSSGTTFKVLYAIREAGIRKMEFSVR